MVGSWSTSSGSVTFYRNDFSTLGRCTRWPVDFLKHVLLLTSEKSWSWKRKAQGTQKRRSPAGNRTRVFRVTGGDTDHYTTEDQTLKAWLALLIIQQAKNRKGSNQSSWAQIFRKFRFSSSTGVVARTSELFRRFRLHVDLSSLWYF